MNAGKQAAQSAVEVPREACVACAVGVGLGKRDYALILPYKRLQALCDDHRELWHVADRVDLARSNRLQA